MSVNEGRWSIARHFPPPKKKANRLLCYMNHASLLASQAKCRLVPFQNTAEPNEFYTYSPAEMVPCIEIT